MQLIANTDSSDSSLSVNEFTKFDFDNLVECPQCGFTLSPFKAEGVRLDLDNVIDYKTAEFPDQKCEGDFSIKVCIACNKYMAIVAEVEAYAGY